LAKDGLSALLRELGVVGAHRGGTDFPGAVYFTIERDISLTAGFVADTAVRNTDFDE
jgi:hypothetical protein